MEARLALAWEFELEDLRNWWEKPESRLFGGLERKTVAQAEKVTFKLVTIAEYIEEYDWTGEFVQEPVDAWRSQKAGTPFPWIASDVSLLDSAIHDDLLMSSSFEMILLLSSSL